MRLVPILVCLGLCVPALAQTNIKNRIGNQLNQAVEEHNQQLEDAMGDKPQQQPAPPQAGAVKAGWLTRKAADGKTDVRLYFAYPATLDKNAPAPGLVVVQEWWGVNEDIQERTREFAQHGFYAVAPDLYHGQVTDDPKKAGELHGKMTDAGAMVDMKTALDLLTEEAGNGVVDAKRVGVIGWCMGGGEALLLSIADPRVKATAIFYGALTSDVEQLKKLQGPVLGIFGNNDKSRGITPADVAKFREGLKAAGKPDADIEILQYDGVGHAFASKAATKMGAYSEPKAKEAWAKAWQWLDAKLGAK